MNEETMVQLEEASPRGAVIRHAPWCFMWSVLALLGVGMIVAQASSRPGLIGGLVVLYALQGLIAEILGVRIDQTSVVVPRRLLSILPFLVLWRARIPLKEIEDVTSMSKTFGIERVLVRWGYGGRTPVIFPNRDKRLLFFQTMKQMRPSINIYRGR